MSELGDVLEVLHRPEPRFQTLRITGREWRHHARLHEAFVRDRPEGSILVAFGASEGAESPEESEQIWRMWIASPDLMRVEFAVGEEMVTAVFRGDTWWSWSPSQGARTNAGRPNMGHGIGPGEGLIEPAVILSAVELNVVGRTEILGRPAYRLRAAPVGDDDWDGSFALHALGSSADEYELLADAERGILLRSEARLGGEPFRVLEITELALDDELSPGTFTLEPPEGETFEDFEPFRHTTLDQLPRLVPFTVFVPERPPGPAPHVSIQNPDRRRATPLSVMLSYMVPKANGEFGNLWIHESREAPELPSGGAEGWRQVSGVLVHEDDSMGYLRCKVRLVRDGTHIELESTAIATHELLVLAQSLVPLPPDPPGLVSVDPGA